MKFFRMTFFSDRCALTASAQLRCAGMQGSGNIDDLAAFGKDEGWQEALLDYAETYAAKVRKDHRQFTKDFRKGLFKPKQA